MKKVLILLSIVLLSISFVLVSCNDSPASDVVEEERQEAVGKDVSDEVFQTFVGTNGNFMTPVENLSSAYKTLDELFDSEDSSLELCIEITPKEENGTFTIVSEAAFKNYYKKYFEDYFGPDMAKNAESSSLTPQEYKAITITYGPKGCSASFEISSTASKSHEVTYNNFGDISGQLKSDKVREANSEDDDAGQLILFDLDLYCLFMSNFSYKVENEKIETTVSLSGLLKELIATAKNADFSASLTLSSGTTKYVVDLTEKITGETKDGKSTITVTDTAIYKQDDKEIGKGACKVKFSFDDEFGIHAEGDEKSETGAMTGAFTLSVTDISIKSNDSNVEITGAVGLGLDINKKTGSLSFKDLKVHYKEDGTESNLLLSCDIAIAGVNSDTCTFTVKNLSLTLDGVSISGNFELKASNNVTAITIQDLKIASSDVSITGNLGFVIDSNNKSYYLAATLSEYVGETEYMAVELGLEMDKNTEGSIIDEMKIYKLVIGGESYSASSFKEALKELMSAKG